MWEILCLPCDPVHCPHQCSLDYRHRCPGFCGAWSLITCQLAPELLFALTEVISNESWLVRVPWGTSAPLTGSGVMSGKGWQVRVLGGVPTSCGAALSGKAL